MPEIAHTVKVTAAERKRDEAMAVLGRLVDASKSESGTLQYALYADTTDAATIWLTELCADEAALNAHMSSPAMAEVAGALEGLLDGPADVRRSRSSGAREIEPADRGATDRRPTSIAAATGDRSCEIRNFPRSRPGRYTISDPPGSFLDDEVAGDHDRGEIIGFVDDDGNSDAATRTVLRTRRGR